MNFKSLFYILLSVLFFCQQLKADDINYIPEHFRFPKYDDIAHSPIEVKYKEQIGTVLFIRAKNDLKISNYLKIYFLTNNNRELNESFNIQFTENEELVSAFIFKEEKSDEQSIFILYKDKRGDSIFYQYSELPLFIDDDGILRLHFFLGDDVFMRSKVCIDNFTEEDIRCEYSTKEGLERYLDKERNK